MKRTWLAAAVLAILCLGAAGAQDDKKPDDKKEKPKEKDKDDDKDDRSDNNKKGAGKS